jgi:hypothetical protein
MGWFDGLAQAQRAAQQNGLTNAAQAGAGSLASLGMNPSMPTMNPDLLKRFMDPNFDPRMEPGFHDPQIPGGMTTDQGFPEAGNRGSGQPINQPMNPNQGHVTPIAGPGWDYNYDPTTGRGTQTNSRGQTTDYNYPASQLPNQGSLQSLGGGQLNQSGMVNLRGPDGSMKAVPQSDMAHWLSKGAVRV